MLYANDFKDKAIWVPEGAEIPVSELMKDLERYGIESHKLATIVCLDEDFVRSTGYKLEKHLIDHMAKAFARAEEEAFILGEGAYEPTGILDDNGAETGVTAQTLTYDSIIQLFFSVKPEYRKHGKWLMNDETALDLRTLKDADGNYLWNHANDTILGKEVLISEFMPSVEVYGSKPVAFGDFSHYEIIDRSRFSIRALNEMFIANQQIGYLGYAFLDGKLTNKEAEKVLSVSAQ